MTQKTLGWVVRNMVVLALALATAGAWSQEAKIRKALGERLPQLRQIDEVRKSEMPGLYEVRVNGADLFYTDAEGNFVLQGNLIDTRARRNLTEERVNQLTAVAFDALPTKDAFTIVRGNGQRKVAVFEDPNCSYCRRFERDLQKVDNVTVYLYLYPILGADSTEKSHAIWCAKDPAKAWNDWMLRSISPAKAEKAANCDLGALQRNVELGRKHRINGTPTLIFTDGSRVPGAIDAPQVEKYLADAKGK